MTNIIVKFIILIIVLGTAFYVFTLTLSRVDEYLKMKALDDCSKSVRYEKTVPAENVKVTIPVQDLYEKCVKDKGY